MELLQRYDWPGNVRELKNVIERAMILAKGPVLLVDLPETAKKSLTYNMTLREVETKHIMEILSRTEWRVRGDHGAAEILGLHPSTLDSLMKRLGIQRVKQNRPFRKNTDMS